jgi:hypothetical protein
MLACPHNFRHAGGLFDNPLAKVLPAPETHYDEMTLKPSRSSSGLHTISVVRIVKATDGSAYLPVVGTRTGRQPRAYPPARLRLVRLRGVGAARSYAT